MSTARSVVLLLCLDAASLLGQARHYRLLDGRVGLAPAVVSAIAQDRDGLLWIGTSGGLFRYDGNRLQRWDPERLDTWIATLTASPNGDVVVIDEKDGAVLEVVPSGTRSVTGPNGPIRGAQVAVFDGSGALWINVGPNLLRRDSTHSWHAIPLDPSDGTLPRILVAVGNEEVLAPTRKAVWRVHARAPPRRLANIPNLVNALRRSDGRILGITFLGQLVEFGDSVTVTDPVARGRGIALAERNGTTWASFDRSLVAIGPDGAIERLGTKEGISGGGPLLVDREGSLWMGSWHGLFQFPEPDTRVWGEGQNLVSDHVRSVSRFGDTLLVDTWQGSAAITRGAAGWTAVRVAPNETGYLYQVDHAGTAWTGSARGILRRRNGHVSLAWHRQAYLRRITDAPSGPIYFATSHGLLVADASGAALRAVAGLPLSSDTAALDFAMVDRAGRLWIAGEGRMCSDGKGPFTSLRPSSRTAEWACIGLPADVPVIAMVAAPSGAIWTVLSRLGVWRLSDKGWEAMPGARNLPTGGAVNLVASPVGGFWVVGPGKLLRVVEDTTRAEGWRVEERLTEWHGLPQSSISDVLEDLDGTLWIATMLGVVRMPASVRRARPSPPRVLLAEGFVDDERIEFDRELRLPYERNRLRLRFTAVSYRDPLMLRFEVRAQPEDRWETLVGTPEFRWVDLEAGHYRAEVRASLDGSEWSREPAAFDFQVLAPWYRSPWALLLILSLVAALAMYLHRARVAVHVELERQRMRIAMDLHDELGSGLGSIGILAGVLRGARESEPSSGDRLASEIGSTAASLGTALSDIVWALDRRSGGLDAVAARLAEHGNRLFANGVRFTTSFPDAWPATRLDVATRRNALLIGVEALHNAARHASPSHVHLAITAAPSGWSLEIADDGRGLPPDAASRGGVGLGSMRRRAEEIGADIQWIPHVGGGTIVRLRMKAFGRRRRAAWRRLVRRREGTLT